MCVSPPGTGQLEVEPARRLFGEVGATMAKLAVVLTVLALAIGHAFIGGFPWAELVSRIR